MSDGLASYLEQNRDKIEKIFLTDDEIKEAIWEAKKRKYFHLIHKDYWDEQERPKAKKK